MKKIILFFVLLLSINLVYSLSSNAETNFLLKFDKPYCDYLSSNPGWWESLNNQYYFTSWQSSNFQCYKENVEFGPTECCPASYSCNRETKKCQDNQVTCKSFLTSEECKANDNHKSVAIAELPLANCGKQSSYGDTCNSYTDCLCSWNGTSCNSFTNYSVISKTTSYGFPLPSNINEICKITEETILPPIGYCDYGNPEIIDECNTTGKRKIIYNVNWVGTSEIPENCKNGEIVTSCASRTILSFFTLIPFLISLLLIIILIKHEIF